MKQIKFKTPIAMKCTQEQYDRDLKQPLKGLGYEEEDMLRHGDFYTILSTNYEELGKLYVDSVHLAGSYLIPTYNPKIFIALASMTVGIDWIVGEWFKYVGSKDNWFTPGKLYQARERSDKGNILRVYNDDEGDFNGYGIENFIKATKEELIEHFTEEVKEEPMQCKGDIEGFPQHVVDAMLDEQERQGNKRDVTVFEYNDHADLCQGGFNWRKTVLKWDGWNDIICNRQFHLIEQPKPQEPKKHRFPFTVSVEEAKRLVDTAPKEHKGIVARTLGKLFMLGKDIEVSEISYEEMREIFNTEQNLVLDEIFGKDEEFIPDGTPCLVRDCKNIGWNIGWNLRYADGKGDFYEDGKKKGVVESWKFYQVLDINNLPVNE